LKTLSIEDLTRELWAIRETALHRMIAQLRAAGGAVKIDVADIEAAEAAAIAARPTSGGVAQLNLHGPISHRPSLWSFFFGGTSTEGFTKILREAVADPAVARIVIDVDSPGGTVDGVPELAEEVRVAREKKPITAVANAEAASAAYWIASQASELVVAPSGEVGSIGVWALHLDVSRMFDSAGITPTFISAGKYKVEGNPFEPLGDEAKAYIQSRIDDYYGMFVRGVAKGRGVSVDKVRSDFGQGRMVGAADAVTAGLADRVGTLDDAIAKTRRAAAEDNGIDMNTRERRHRLLQLAAVR